MYLKFIPNGNLYGYAISINPSLSQFVQDAKDFFYDTSSEIFSHIYEDSEGNNSLCYKWLDNCADTGIYETAILNCLYRIKKGNLDFLYHRLDNADMFEALFPSVFYGLLPCREIIIILRINKDDPLSSREIDYLTTVISEYYNKFKIMLAVTYESEKEDCSYSIYAKDESETNTDEELYGIDNEN